MTDSLQDVVADMRLYSATWHRPGSIDAEAFADWIGRLSALAAPVVSDVEPTVKALMDKWDWLILSRVRDEFEADLRAALSPGRSGDE